MECVMKGFWENIAQLSKGQLFNGGYLSKEAALRLTEDRCGGKSNGVDSSKQRREVWPRLATPH